MKQNWHRVLIGEHEAAFMETSVSAAGHQRRKAGMLVVLMMLALLPLSAPVASADGGRDASIQVTAIPTALTVNPGEAGEYTIRVRNTGSNPVTVQLSTSQEPGEACNGFSSTITQITGPIDSGASEDATMNVTLTQTAEGDCDTTVTVNAQEQATPPDVAGAPAQESVTVTTTSGDGSGSALFGVDLIIDDREKNWAGQEEIDFSVEVENTGQTNETVALSVDSASGDGCIASDDFTVTLSDETVNVDQEESETVTVSIEVPEGQAADDYCWEITGTVTNDPTQEASDVESFQLNVPVLKQCTVSLSKTSVSVRPDAQATLTVTFANDGNADWTIATSAGGTKASWVRVDGASSGLLPYDNGNGQRSFDLIVSPDDSVRAGTSQTVPILGKEGQSVKCQTDLTVVVGQSYGASISLATSLLSNIQPGQNESTTVTVTNLGNGPDNLRVASSSAPTGWAVQLEQSTVSVGSMHDADDDATLSVTVRVPTGALATEEIELVLSVLPSSGGTAYDTVTLRVTVAAVHGMEISVPSTDQTGRSGTDVRFPIDISNEGNVRDSIRLSAVSQTASPAWGTSFETTEGMPFTEIDVEPRSTLRVFLVVSIDGEEELENTRVTVRVRNMDDTNSADEDNDGIPDNQREATFLAVLSDRNFSMSLRFDDADTANSASLVLPPAGTATYGLWIQNTGDGNDEAIFTVGGLEGLATRDLVAYGLPVTGEVPVPKGFGVWDVTNGSFVFGEDGTPLLGTGANDDIARTRAENMMVENGYIDGYQVRAYEVYLELTVRVNPGAETGQSGQLQIIAASVSNAADTTATVTLSLEVSIVHDLTFDTDSVRREVAVTYGASNHEEVVTIVNTGNIETDIRIFTSDNLRGWSVVLDTAEGSDCTFDAGELVCTVDEGESVNVTVTIRPPFGAELEDTYKFTLSAEPSDTGVLDRQNMEFVVQGTPADGVLSLANNTTVQAGAAGLILLLLVALLFRRR